MTCTAAARLSDEYAWLVVMWATRWHFSTSSFASPDISVPNTNATSPPTAASATASAAAAWASIACGDSSRRRAVSAIASVVPASASSSVALTCARASRSSAPVAIASACGSGKRRGATSARRASPIVFIARAAPPMLPGWVVRTSTTRMRAKLAGSPSRLARIAPSPVTPPAFPPMPVLHPTLHTAVKAARRAGSIINRAARDIDGLAVTAKRKNDFVTEVDRAAEDAVIETIRKAYPDHAFLAEESGASGRSEYTWIIDPLDGTTNFIHGFPQYAVSIALRHREHITQAVVYDPTRNELFTATRGRGAFLNERRIRVSKRDRLAECLIGTGFPFRSFEHLDEYVGMFKSVTEHTAGIRRPGAAALDLAYVAAGRLDGFWEIGLSSWDMAAASLLILEAGGLVSNFDGESTYLEDGHIVSGAPKVFPQLLKLVGDVHRARKR